MTHPDVLQARAKALHLQGLLAHWPEALAVGWVEPLLDWEDEERARRSVERRLRQAQIGRFKSVCDFDWTWPKHCDHATFEVLMALDFLKDAANAVLVGPTASARRRWRTIWPIRRLSAAIPCCSPMRARCSATWPHSLFSLKRAEWTVVTSRNPSFHVPCRDVRGCKAAA